MLCGQARELQRNSQTALGWGARARRTSSSMGSRVLASQVQHAHDPALIARSSPGAVRLPPQTFRVTTAGRMAGSTRQFGGVDAVGGKEREQRVVLVDESERRGAGWRRWDATRRPRARCARNVYACRSLRWAARPTYHSMSTSLSGPGGRAGATWSSARVSAQHPDRHAGGQSGAMGDGRSLDPQGELEHPVEARGGLVQVGVTLLRAERTQP